MIGEMQVEVGGKDYTIRADWKTGQVIAERVADPFTILTESAKAMLDHTYQPSVTFDMVTSVKILHAAIEAAGESVAIEDIGNAFIGPKMQDAINQAMAFVTLFSADADLLTGGDEDEGKATAGVNS